jgi:hypothetical protein
MSTACVRLEEAGAAVPTLAIAEVLVVTVVIVSLLLLA